VDEHEFDSLFQQLYEREEAARAERRLQTLAARLFGFTVDDLQRQLLASSPEIPPGFGLDDFRRLQYRARLLVASLQQKGPRFSWLPGALDEIISVGDRRFTLLEARYEVVRRAVEHLEGR
jgi:hypothetical protein